MLPIFSVTNLREFFRSRFSLRDNALWRVMQLLRRHRGRIVLANVLIGISQALAAIGLVALFPLFDYALNRAAAGHAPTPAAQVAPATHAHGDKAVREAEKQLARQSRHNQQIADNVLHWSWARRARDAMYAKKAELMAWAAASPNRYITLYALFIVVVFLVRGAADFIGNSMLDKISIDASAEVMTRVYGNVLRQELEFFDHTSSGSLLNSCYREVFNLQSLVKILASTRVMTPINMLILFFALLAISLPLSVMLVVLLPLVIVPTMMVTRRLRGSLGDEIGEESEVMDVMTQGIHGVQAIKAFGAEEFELRQLEPAVRGYVRSTRARRLAQAAVGPLVDILNMFVLLLVFVITLRFFLDRIDLSGGKLMVFLFTITRFYRPMTTLMKMNVSMARARALAARIFALLDREPRIRDAADAVDFPAAWDRIELENLSLSYRVMRRRREPRLREALRDVNLVIRRGESVAIIGPNGAGKSSIVKLLCRLYEPTTGEIRIGATPLHRIRLASIREKICLISQHPVLFNRSVSENIAFGLEGIGHAEIEAAARAAGAEGFIQRLPHGYDTFVGEDGRLLSGGERQKLVLARAFVRRPAILILDEPTTGLDRATVDEFLELIGRLNAAGTTILYITHEHAHLPRFQRVLEFTPTHTLVELARAQA